MRQRTALTLFASACETFAKNDELAILRRNHSTYNRVRAAGGGHQVADDALRLPWGGIFRFWRPLIHLALAAEQALKLAKSP
jgi:hypothetical protein